MGDDSSMLLAGSTDGAYRVTGLHDDGDGTVGRVLDAGRVSRVCRFEDVPGVFAATDTGLFHSTDGAAWADLGVPTEKVYSVGVSPGGERVYAGTRPAAVYVADLSERDDDDAAAGGDGIAGDDALVARDLSWRELEGFQDLPSREEWRLPRHEDLAQVRDVHVTATDPDHVVAGVEVGGVHASANGGETWTERRDGIHDDVHELVVVADGEYVVATGFGLYRTTDAGETWTRLDDAFDQRYFRATVAVDDDVYAGANMANTSRWEDDDADAALFVSRNGAPLERVETPRPAETPTGFTTVDGDVVAGTHRGTLLRETATSDWTVAGSIPVPEDTIVSYTPLTWLAD